MGFFRNILVFCFAVVLAWPLPARAVEDGLVGYWKMDEIAEPYWADGQVGGGLAITNTGVDNDVVLYNTFGTALDFGTGDFSACLWRISTNTTWHNMLSTMAGVGKNWYFQKENGGNPRHLTFGIGSSGDLDSDSVSIFGDGLWHHVCFTADRDSNVTFYVDGNPEGIVDISPYAADDLIGDGDSRLFLTNQSFEGTMDDVRIYNRVLSPAEITAIYTNTSPPTSGLVLHWEFDDGSGLTATDSSGNGFDATLENFSGPIVLDSAGTNHGVPQGGVTLYSPSGIHGNGLEFDGLDDTRVETNSLFGTPLEFGTGDFSGCLWRKGSGNNWHFYLHQVAGTGWLFQRNVAGDPNPITFRLRGPGINDFYSNAVTIDDGLWHHLCFTADRDDVVTFYVDGQEEGTADISALAGSDLVSGGGSGRLWIGDLDSGGGAFNGQIDDVRIYNRALSPEEIAQIYNADCVGPDGLEATIIYNADAKVPQYCAGREWVGFAESN